MLLSWYNLHCTESVVYPNMYLMAFNSGSVGEKMTVEDKFMMPRLEFLETQNKE
jgi:hypothetical protein